ncbi:TRAP transporter small permease [Ruegeria sediminis]|uniref:TRAP transporter small permease protein n=1 Tax=Ruegeria sediminis TaxID=2583820 RepID=A0ABY2X0X6_9RHOB|nr:TRAP transporter small permease [Ruegeria sediminis]TMV08850.1 TRAP transporter small permease [Ruegeria sediminis]
MHPHKSESWVDRIEETIIAVLLGLMTVITFANVVARYVFNHNILWALELTVFMFGWLVLLGASYAVKKNAHLGVDVIINMLPPHGRRTMALFSAGVCILFSLLLLKGSWDYWANFANLPQTTGRWFPTGFEAEFRPKAWYETNDIPHPGFLAWMEAAFNEGDEYEKLPRLIPYMVLPISAALLLLRFVQATYRIWEGTDDRLVASHEAEDDLEEVRRHQGDAD